MPGLLDLMGQYGQAQGLQGLVSQPQPQPQPAPSLQQGLQGPTYYQQGYGPQQTTPAWMDIMQKRLSDMDYNQYADGTNEKKVIDALGQHLGRPLTLQEIISIRAMQERNSMLVGQSQPRRTY